MFYDRGVSFLNHIALLIWKYEKYEYNYWIIPDLP